MHEEEGGAGKKGAMKKSFQKKMTRANWATHFKGANDEARKAHRCQKNGVKRKLDKMFMEDYAEELMYYFYTPGFKESSERIPFRMVFPGDTEEGGS